MYYECTSMFINTYDTIYPHSVITLNHRYALLIMFLLLVPPLIASSLATTGDAISLISTGAISYLPTGSRLMGVNHYCASGCDPLEDHFILLQQCKATDWREQMVSTDWASSYSYHYTSIKQWAALHNVRLTIGTMGMDWEHINGPDKTAIITSSSATQTWIDAWKPTIQGMQPYAIDIINEPDAITPFSTYRDFCIKVINGWYSVKPDLVFIVEDSPFWSLQNWAANPILSNEVSTSLSKIVYAYHQYYALETNPNTDPDASQWMRDYYNGNPVLGKTEMRNEFLNDIGLATLKSKGCSVLIEETGTNLDSPNSLVFMQDMYDFCKEENFSVLQHAMVPHDYVVAGWQSGMLKSDNKNLNDLGLVWQRNMQA
jgi:hypothetical protein